MVVRLRIKAKIGISRHRDKCKRGKQLGALTGYLSF